MLALESFSRKISNGVLIAFTLSNPAFTDNTCDILTAGGWLFTVKY